MPLSMRQKAIAVGATVAALVGLSYAAKKAKQRTKSTTKTPSLEGVYELGARLPERVVNDVQPPIDLSFEPRTVTLDGTIVDGSSTVENTAAVANLVTDISQERSNIAYDHADNLMTTGGLDMTNSSERDQLVKRVVSTIAPRVDWSQGLVKAFDSPEGRVWRGVQLIVELAYGTNINKEALGLS